MPNIAWYLSFGFGSVLLFFFTLWKSFIPRSKALLVYLSFSGLAYILEYVIKVIFYSYNYYPHVFENRWYDSLFGAVISQGIIVPSIAMCIVAFRLNTLWVVGFCFLIMGVEELFLRLKIYEHHWWETIYTGILTFIGFNMAKWWERLLVNRKPWMDMVNIYLILILFSNTVVYLLTSLFKGPLFHMGVFQDRLRDSTFIEALLIFIYSIVVSFMIQQKWKWRWFLGIYFVSWGFAALFEEMGVLEFFHFWNPALFACIPVLVALFTYWLFNKLVKRLET